MTGKYKKGADVKQSDRADVLFRLKKLKLAQPKKTKKVKK